MNFFIDENISHRIATALDTLDKDNNVYSIPIYFKAGTADEIWIKEISKLDGIVITQDININRTKKQWDLFTKNNLGGFFIKTPQKTEYWDLIKIIINNWEEIIMKSKKTKRPFGYKITPRGKMELLEL